MSNQIKTSPRQNPERRRTSVRIWLSVGAVTCVMALMSAGYLGDHMMPRARAATSFTWTGASGSDWFTDTNWSPNGVPGNADSAIINAGASVNAGSHVSVTNLDFDGNSFIIGGTLTVTGVMNWTSGTMRPVTWNMPVASALNISGSSDKTIIANGSTVVNNAGTATWTGTGNINLIFDVGIGNTGTFNVQGDANMIQMGGGCASFINSGTFTKSATAGTTTIELCAFNNNSTVSVQTGTLAISGNGQGTSSSNGNFDGSAGPALNHAQRLLSYFFSIEIPFSPMLSWTPLGCLRSW